MCKFNLVDTEHMSKINTQIVQLTVAANSLTVTNRLWFLEYSIGRLDTSTSTILPLEIWLHFAKRVVLKNIF